MNDLEFLDTDTCYCTKKVLHLSVIINKESFIVVIKFGLSGLLSWSVSGYAHSGEGGTAK